MPKTYYDTVQLIERMHRHFLDVLKIELEKLSIQDINNVQSLILYNIGGDDLTVGELTVRGYYLGSNVSYNVKKMVEAGYLMQERSQHDRRSVRVHLSAKGKELKNTLSEIFMRHMKELKTVELDEDKLTVINERIRLLERFWASRSTPASMSDI
ncbi:MAG: Transcriptional regulator, MarR family [Alphaproteobacteria bacterium]|nr:Transcriptional regulator, MarR family [Alphaproteobacteria bacterium]